MYFLENSHSKMPSKKGELDASVVMSLSLPWSDFCVIDSLLYKFVKILDVDEILGLPPSMIILIPRAGM